MVNVFIVFVKFLGWIVAIWVRLARPIEEKMGLRFWKGVNYLNKIYNNYNKKKKLDPRGAWAPLGPHLGPSLYATKCPYYETI